MDFSQNSAVRSSESQPQSMPIKGLGRCDQGGRFTSRNVDAKRAVRSMGRWSSLLLVLLLSGLAEAGLGRASLAQLNDGAGIEQNAKPIVIDPAQTTEAIDAAPTIPDAPDVTPEAIVIPRAETAEELGEAEPDAIAPPVVEAPTVEVPMVKPPMVEDIATPEQSPGLGTDAAEVIPTEEAEEASPELLEAETETAETEAAERVYLAEQQISFVPPVGFTAMSLEEIKAKFPGSMPPKYAYANEDRDITVGITVSDIPLEAEQLPEVKTVLEDFLESSVPGFQWLEHDFVNLGGQDWIKLEFISETKEQRIHNDMYITSLQGKLLGFNFNANLAVDFALRDLLQASRNSILLNETVASDD